jgi:hypothetical protein
MRDYLQFSTHRPLPATGCDEGKTERAMLKIVFLYILIGSILATAWRAQRRVAKLSEARLPVETATTPKSNSRDS